MNKEKPYFLKRFIAYLIDLIIVVLLASAVSLVLVDSKKTSGYTEELLTLTKKYTSKEITQEEFNKQSNELNYYISKDSVDVSIINCVTSLVYFVILCYFCHGITLGKYLMKLQIVSANDKKLHLGHYLIRGLLVNLILSNLISIILIIAMNKDTFISVYPKVSSALTLFYFATVVCIMYRNDGRGLHDLLANTKVISTKTLKVQEEVVEAKVVDEKMENKNSKKGSDKK